MNSTPLEPTVTEPGSSDNPPPDCPMLVEDLADAAADVDMMAHCLVYLVGEIPRLDSPDAERALKRVGRMAERVANVASTTALRAEVAVQLVRGRNTPPPSGNGRESNGNGNGNGEA